MRCPECELPLDTEWRCPNNHTWPLVNAVRTAINADLSRTLDPFLKAFRTYRNVAGERLLEPGMYNRLPESGMDYDPGLWQLRKYDLEIIAQLAGVAPNPVEKRPLRILDVGAWNGWLSHRLAALGHDVTATDVFTDAYDGLGAVQHYPAKFRAVQADQERLHLFDGPYDLIIAQRCMGYVVDIRRSMDQMKGLLAPGGTIVLTGLNIFRDPRSIRKHFAQSALRFTEQYGLPFFFKNVKGYLDLDDKHTLEQCGVQIMPYHQLKWKNIISGPFKRKPLYYYGTWHRPRNDG
ncbi:MAG: class I SAM-dependent methyltransferase [Flavobacteriales bacterium]|nr:class I SAM-dependent methyltransferase [Flavobacteriales bacterium]